MLPELRQETISLPGPLLTEVVIIVPILLRLLLMKFLHKRWQVLTRGFAMLLQQLWMETHRMPVVREPGHLNKNLPALPTLLLLIYMIRKPILTVWFQVRQIFISLNGHML